MTTNAKANAGFTAKFRTTFKPRDIFLHDGKSLRRFTIGARVQLAAVLAAFVLLAWSTFATIEAVSAVNSAVVTMQRPVAQMQAGGAPVPPPPAHRAAVL